MKALVTWSVVIDLEPDAIPAFAARVERMALDALNTQIEEIAAAQGPLTEDEAEEFRDLLQVYGASYSVQQQIEVPIE